MDYLELHVFRPAGENEQPQRGIATVMAKGKDLFQSLERSVAELRKSGWAVDDVRAFQTDFKLELAGGRERMRSLYNRALDEGIDWYVEPMAPTVAARAYAETTSVA